MAAPREFTLEAVRCFIIEKGGKVTNHELVKHFKQFLTDPATKESARIQFKEYVNTLATIKQEEQEKYLVLKRRFYAANYADFLGDSLTPQPTSPTGLYSPSCSSPGMPLPLPEFRAPPPYRPPPEPYRPPPELYRFNRSSSLDPPSPLRPEPPAPMYPPPFRHRDDTPPPLPPPPVQRPPPVLLRQASLPSQDASLESNASFLPPYSLSSSSSPFDRPVSVNDLMMVTSQSDDSLPPPAIPPRRKPITSRGEDKENTFNSVCSSSSSSADNLLSDNNEPEVKISVKERTQRFNKMASEVDLQRGNNSSSNGNNRRDHKPKAGGEDDDTSSVGTMEPHGGKEWMLAIARGDYHTISRLLREEPRLARRRDFVTGYTGLHWAAKHGNDALVKMLAGTYKSDVNARTNAGCTPLHIAAQQGHEEVFDLLVKTYGADSNLRDYSGKKPYQYFPRQDTCISSDTFRKITAKRNLAAEREEKEAAGFLRIGSLNVRVKKTTEAFNNLLSSAGGYNKAEKQVTKLWGSADNLLNTADGQLMPPPKQVPNKKKRPKDWPHPLITNQPSTFTSPPPLMESNDESDSDSACGFGNEWKNP